MLHHLHCTWLQPYKGESPNCFGKIMSLWIHGEGVKPWHHMNWNMCKLLFGTMVPLMECFMYLQPISANKTFVECYRSRNSRKSGHRKDSNIRELQLLCCDLKDTWHCGRGEEGFNHNFTLTLLTKNTLEMPPLWAMKGSYKVQILFWSRHANKQPNTNLDPWFMNSVVIYSALLFCCACYTLCFTNTETSDSFWDKSTL